MTLFRTFLFILCLPTLLAIGSLRDNHASYSRGEIPSWVKPLEASLDPVSVKPSQANVQELLYDMQFNWEEKTLYIHDVSKALTQSGVTSISQISINFSPSFQRVVMHSLRVHRGGNWFDRLETSRHKVIQKEKGLDQSVYSGDLTAVYFLDDIRVGDVVDCSYSIIGEAPLSTSKLVRVLPLQFQVPIEKISCRVVAHPDLAFQIKPFNTAIEPKISDVSPNLREWVWEATEVIPYTRNSNEPEWYSPWGRVELSQYPNWKEVAEQRYTLYVLPQDLKESIPLEMRDLIEQWKESAADTSELALKAIRFVQDEVRYLSLSEGIGGWQPSHPGLTFQRRFGDCKDKSFLLHAFLYLMDIPSAPVLVHTMHGKWLSERLPTPYLSNHVVLQLEVDGTTYWVDPTRSPQGGSLQTNHFPSYGWGLVLTDKTEALTSLPQKTLKNPIEIDTIYVIESEDSACMKVKATFYGSEADYMRGLLKRKGLKGYSEERLAEIQEVYGWGALDGSMKVQDDRENNVLTGMISYRLPTQGVSDSKFLDVYSHVLRKFLPNRVNPARTSPYGIEYPLWVRERIYVENPLMDWESCKEEYLQENEFISYSLNSFTEGSGAYFEIELQHLQDHIPKDALRDYWNMLKDIRRNAPQEMNIALPMEGLVP